MNGNNASSILVGKHKGKGPFGRPSLDGRIILKFSLNSYDLSVRTGFIWLLGTLQVNYAWSCVRRW
jgi:hypothetical protein